MKMIPMASKIYQSCFKILPNTKFTLKILPKTLRFCQNGEISPNLVTLEPFWSCLQCDQMARLLVQFFWPFMSFKIFPITNKLPKKFKNFDNTKKPFNKWQRLLKCCQSGEIWSHSFTLGTDYCGLHFRSSYSHTEVCSAALHSIECRQ